MHRDNNQYSNYVRHANSRQIQPLYSSPWDTGNQKPVRTSIPASEAFNLHIAQLKEKTESLTAVANRLENEVEALKANKENLKEKASKVSECRKMMSLWSGFEIEKYNDKLFNVAFHTFRKGGNKAKYTIGLIRTDNVWNVNYHALPPCMKMVPQRVREAAINSTDKLVKMIRMLRFEVDMFSRRQEQFEEAKALQSHTLRIYPSFNTLNVMVEVDIDDDSGSDLTSMSVQLSYQLDQFLPKTPLFHFKGGSTEDREELKAQLSYLEYMPLKDALISSFNLNASTESTTPSNSHQKENVETSKVEDNFRTQDSDSKSPDSDPPSPPPAKRSARTAVRGTGRGRGRGTRGKKSH